MILSLETKSIISPDLDYEAKPAEPGNCSIFIEVEIGVRGKEGADIFSFTVITPRFLEANAETRWGRGYLIVEAFSWNVVESTLERLLTEVRKDTWDGVVAELSKHLWWEFDGYQRQA